LKAVQFPYYQLKRIIALPMLIQKVKIAVVVASALLLFAACGSNDVGTKNDETNTRGEITIAVDESLKPVMEQQLKVWDSSYPQGKITAQYLPENECFDKLYANEARLIITTRDISPQEKDAYAANKIVTRSLDIAEDAIAVVLHPSSPDTLMTLGQLKAILEGNFVRTYTAVFDNGKSSMVRYITDSLIRDGKLSSNVYAAGNNDAVVDYVSKNPNALGIVGVSHIYDPEDASGLGKFKEGIKIAAMQNDSIGKFYQPFQGTIALHLYPLTRKRYFVSRETWQGLGTGFANFLSQQQGQLIFKKARMVPLRVALEVQEVEIR
jgi:phosphate transport system substrate-binding protein